MTTHATADARLAGARAAHTQDDAVCKMLAVALRRHPDDCEGVQHILGRPECEVFRAALVVLGMGGAS